MQPSPFPSFCHSALGRYKTQVTGHRSGHRSQVTGQVTGHRAQVTGHRS